MKVKDLNGREVDINKVMVEAWRSNATGETYFTVHGLKYWDSTDAVLAIFIDMNEALDYAEELKSRMDEVPFAPDPGEPVGEAYEN